MFNKITGRNFVASTWFDTSGMTRREKLYAKARELVAGDRVEIAIDTGDCRYFDIALSRQIESGSTQ